jgi:hypothetical protein
VATTTGKDNLVRFASVFVETVVDIIHTVVGATGNSFDENNALVD